MIENIDSIKKIFLKETGIDTWDYYEKTLTIPSLCWDYIVLTSSNEEQKESFEYEIDYRKKQNMIPQYTKFLVVPDPGGKRVGSGGATLNVLNEIKKLDSRNFSELKILIIHSGGDSKRVPQYSSCGKLFSPVQKELPNGKISSLFDELLITLSSISSRMASGMLVVSGDILLLFNPLQVDLYYSDCAAISIKEKVEIGKNHGVFLTDENNILREFLHKQSIEVLNEKGAVNSYGNIDIDTGAIYFSSEVIESLYSLLQQKNGFNKFINDEVRLNLYGDFLYPFSSNVTKEDYLKQESEGINPEKIKIVRNEIWEKLNKYNMRVIKTSPSMFIHFGTTKELLNLVSNVEKYSFINWKKNVLSNVDKKINFCSYGSYICDSSKIGKNSFIEKSYIGCNSTIGKNSIISNSKIENVNIPSNICLSTLLLNNGKYISRIYSVEDNPKELFSSNLRFLGKDFKHVLKKYDIDKSLIWNSNEKDESLWSANLFKVSEDENESILNSLMLYDIFSGKASFEDAKNYFACERMSLKSSFNSSNPIEMKNNYEQIEIKIITSKFINLLNKKSKLEDIEKLFISTPNLKLQIFDIIDFLQNASQDIKYRAYLMLSKVVNKFKQDCMDSNELEDKCFEEIKNSIITFRDEEKNIYYTKDFVKVELPIRVNFAGTWSDAPPYCLENGGEMINGAFLLNGEKPIKVMIKKTNKKSILLKSLDLNVENEITDIEVLKDCSNTNDLFSLPKASLIISGIVNKNDRSIDDVYKRLNGGLEFITAVENIPKGSGLGTSSILSAACLKAIYSFVNIEIDDISLCTKVLQQEQLMGTGGGWQDQIGGLIKGLKRTHTKPGNNQEFIVENIEISSEMRKMFNEKLVLIYTGQRRLAKNLLRNIMGGYILNKDDIPKNIHKIKSIVLPMNEAIKNNNICKFKDLLNEHWRLSKLLDKGCTNTCINEILHSCEDLIDAKMICGAGGGGFLQVILKEDVSKNDIEERINLVFQDSGIKCYDVTLVED